LESGEAERDQWTEWSERGSMSGKRGRTRTGRGMRGQVSPQPCGFIGVYVFGKDPLPPVLWMTALLCVSKCMMDALHMMILTHWQACLGDESDLVG
jgi:hypothetical protein